MKREQSMALVLFVVTKCKEPLRQVLGWNGVPSAEDFESGKREDLERARDASRTVASALDAVLEGLDKRIAEIPKQGEFEFGGDAKVKEKKPKEERENELRDVLRGNQKKDAKKKAAKKGAKKGAKKAAKKAAKKGAKGSGKKKAAPIFDLPASEKVEHGAIEEEFLPA